VPNTDAAGDGFVGRDVGSDAGLPRLLPGGAGLGSARGVPVGGVPVGGVLVGDGVGVGVGAL
jgi:hypothetical protein